MPCWMPSDFTDLSYFYFENEYSIIQPFPFLVGNHDT